METISLIGIELKADESAEGAISGYGAVFGNRDRQGDILAKGSVRLPNGLPLMLWHHDPREVIGKWDILAEDEGGLRMKGRLALATRRGREAYELLKLDALSGLSIGYTVVKADYTDEARILEEIDLVEVSLVSYPANPLARIDAVKAAGMTEREIERLLTGEAGLSRGVARKLIAGGFKALGAPEAETSPQTPSGTPDAETDSEVRLRQNEAKAARDAELRALLETLYT